MNRFLMTIMQCLILILIVAVITLVIVGPTQGDRFKTTPRDFTLSRKGAFLHVEQKGYREADINLKHVISVVVYDKGQGEGLPHPTVSVALTGGSFRMDVKTMEDARRLRDALIKETK